MSLSIPFCYFQISLAERLKFYAESDTVWHNKQQWPLSFLHILCKPSSILVYCLYAEEHVRTLFDAYLKLFCINMIF